MKQYLTPFLCLSALLLLSSPVQAEPLIMKEANISFETPKGWSIAVKEGSVQLKSADKSAIIFLHVNDIQESEAFFSKQIKRYSSRLKALTPPPPIKYKVNNFVIKKQVLLGTIAEKNTAAEVFQIKTAAKKTLNIVAFIQNPKKHQATLRSFTKSISLAKEKKLFPPKNFNKIHQAQAKSFTGIYKISSYTKNEKNCHFEGAQSTLKNPFIAVQFANQDKGFSSVYTRTCPTKKKCLAWARDLGNKKWTKKVFTNPMNLIHSFMKPMPNGNFESYVATTGIHKKKENLCTDMSFALKSLQKNGDSLKLEVRNHTFNGPPEKHPSMGLLCSTTAVEKMWQYRPCSSMQTLTATKVADVPPCAKKDCP